MKLTKWDVFKILVLGAFVVALIFRTKGSAWVWPSVM